MEGTSVIGSLGAIAFGAVLTSVSVLQWLGRLGRRGDPRAVTERLYLLLPVGLAPLLLGLLLLLDALGVAVPEAVTGSLLLLLLVTGLAALVVFFVQPDRLRPRWQRDQLERRRRRNRPAAGTGPFVLELGTDGEPERHPRRFPERTAATVAARRLLEEQDEVAYVTVHDTRVGVAVEIIER
jgi:hypothetical protein